MALPAIGAVLAGPLLGKIIDVVMLAAKGVPAAIKAVEAWRSKDKVTLEQLQQDSDEILAVHNRVQES